MRALVSPAPIVVAYHPRRNHSVQPIEIALRLLRVKLFIAERPGPRSRRAFHRAGSGHRAIRARYCGQLLAVATPLVVALIAAAGPARRDSKSTSNARSSG